MVTIKHRFPAIAGKPAYIYIGESIFVVFSAKYL